MSRLRISLIVLATMTVVGFVYFQQIGEQQQRQLDIREQQFSDAEERWRRITAPNVTPAAAISKDELTALASHRAYQTIEPILDGNKLHLNTYCLAPDSNLWLCCIDSVNASKGHILRVTPEGDFVSDIPLDFVPTAINVSHDKSACYVAGSNKIIKLSVSGELLLESEIPNAASDPERLAELREQQRLQREQLAQAYEAQLKRLDYQIERLEKQIGQGDKLEQRIVERAERRLTLLKEQRQEIAQVVSLDSDDVAVGDDTSQSVTGLAATRTDVFIAILSMVDYGYDIRRFDLDLAESVSVNRDLNGCCGQLDLQADGDELIVAENTKFEVGRYDRDGNRLSGFGDRSTAGLQGWGSCCNPMNVRCCENGDILTAESSIGHIKRYDKRGQFLGYIGTAKIGGGCKHVAIAHDSSRDWYFFMNVGGNNISVLLPKEQATGETPDEVAARIANEQFRHRLQGVWMIQKEKQTDATESVDTSSITEYLTQQYKTLRLDPNGSLMTSSAVSTNDTMSDEIKSALSSLLGEGQSLEPTGYQSWEIIGSDGPNNVSFSIYQGDIQTFGATVSFVNDSEATWNWFYGTPSEKLEGKATSYKRVEDLQPVAPADK